MRCLVSRLRTSMGRYAISRLSISGAELGLQADANAGFWGRRAAASSAPGGLLVLSVSVVWEVFALAGWVVVELAMMLFLSRCTPRLRACGISTGPGWARRVLGVSERRGLPLTGSWRRLVVRLSFE